MEGNYTSQIPECDGRKSEPFPLGSTKTSTATDPKTWNPMWATWGKCMVIQTCRVFLAPHRFRDFIRFCFRMGLKGMILTWISKCQERTMQIRRFFDDAK